MASPVNNTNTYINDGLWKTSCATSEVLKNLTNLSLSSIFAIDIKADKLLQNLNKSKFQGFGDITTNGLQTISLLAYEAVLPGSSYELSQVFGDRQGLTEQYPTKRVYPPIDVSFYIDNQYELLRFFNSWMELISPLTGGPGQNSFYKFNYPDTYECDINVVKFERNFRPSGERLTKKGTDGGINDPSTYTYTLKNAFPSSMISVPVSYNQSEILRTTVTFNYDRFWVQQNKGNYFADTQPLSQTQNNTIDTINRLLSNPNDPQFLGGAVDRLLQRQ